MDEKHRLILMSMIEDIYDEIIKDKRCCPVCKSELRLYLPVVAEDGHIDKNIKCPVCGSYNRHRSYAVFLEKNHEILKRTKRLLHFAPERCLYEKLCKMKHIDYYPVDIDEGNPRIRERVDITQIPYEDNSFDLIICNHVLEHVLDDKKAMKELYRVLSPEGIALINVPVSTLYSESFENEAYNTPELRLKYFGQSDHVRWYGTNFPKLLESVGFSVTEVRPHLNATDEEIKKMGVFRDELIYVCRS